MSKYFRTENSDNKGFSETIKDQYIRPLERLVYELTTPAQRAVALNRRHRHVKELRIDDKR